MRQALVFFHRYVGLALAAILFVAGLTGAVLAFQREIDGALNPDLYRARSGAAPLPLDDLKAGVEARLPQASVGAIQPPWEPGATALLRVEPRKGAVLDYDEVYVDPGTGAVQGTRLWGACCLGRKEVVPFLFKLHYTLHLPGLWGVWITGGAAVLWTLDCFVALALSAPRGGRILESWRRAISIKPGAGGHRRLMDLHRAPGLWLWVVLLLIAATGVGLNLRDQVFEPVVSIFTPVSPPIFKRPIPPGERPDAVTFDGAVAQAMSSAQAQGRPGHAAYVLYSPDLHLYGIAVATRAEGDPRAGMGPDWYYVDARDGRLRAAELAGRGALGDVIMQARLPLHTGLILDVWGQILVCLAGIATAALSFTGVLVWASKRRARNRKTAPPQRR